MNFVRRASERGVFDHGWLKTAHTFSFGDYRDPRFMGFRALRVINEDVVEPGEGFPMHPHRDMEILTYIIEGALEHRDSMGSGSVIRPGDMQYMSAASGVLHSEFNPSKDKPVHLLQIWILPAESGGKPLYSEAHFAPEKRRNRLCLVASEDGREGALRVRQDVELHASLLDKGQAAGLPCRKGRYFWIQLAKGRIEVDDLP
ncbi:MAG: pirin family protein [Proteobacteria bacterium]|nr:pirin family protein [Pseudomonadota bacterium]